MMLLIWQLLYPIITYNLIAEACFFFLELEDPLLIQGIAAAAATCLLLPFYLGRRKRMERNPEGGGEQPGRGRPAVGVYVFFFCVIGAASSILLNNLIFLTGLDLLLTDYEEVSDIIYSSPFLVQLSMSAVVIPVVEELIFRGMGYAALRTRYSVRVSMVVSAFLFGAFHGNLMQFIYAFAIGLILAWCYEAGGGLWAPVLAHGTANAVSVVFEYTGFEYFLDGPAFLLETVLAGLCLLAVIKGYNKRYRSLPE